MAQQLSSTTGKRRKSSLLHQYWKHRYLMMLFLPAIAYYIIFHYGPLYGIQIAFKEYMIRQGIWGSPWVGFTYFEELFTARSFKQVFANTLTISFLKLFFNFPAPIIFAILLNELKGMKFKRTVQTISYLPHFISWVVLGGLFMQLLSPSSGPVNHLLKNMGLKPIYFLADNNWFRPVLVFTSMWKGFGWGSIIYLAAISNVDPELYEAAVIDGAGRFRKIWHVTLPALTPVITIMLIFAVGGIINDDFDQIFNLYSSSVYKTGDVLSTYIYRVGIVDMRYPFSAAAGLFKNVLSFVLVFGTNAIAKRINEYGIW